MLSRDFYAKADAVAIGAAQRTVSLGSLRNIKIDVPSLESQKHIADILSAYDDLIENNQKQIKLLEEAAQRLYKEWFVDLRFPGHENTKIVDGVPEGWNWCKLEDAIQFDPKVTLTKERMKQFVPMSALSKSIFSPQMNGCAPLQRILWSITLTFGPAARRCLSA